MIVGLILGSAAFYVHNLHLHISDSDSDSKSDVPTPPPLEPSRGKQADLVIGGLFVRLLPPPTTTTSAADATSVALSSDGRGCPGVEQVTRLPGCFTPTNTCRWGAQPVELPGCRVGCRCSFWSSTPGRVPPSTGAQTPANTRSFLIQKEH